MAKDSQGMDLGQVEALVTAAIMIVPYSNENKITPEMIASSKATPELPAAYNRSTACIGLVKSDGGNQDSRDGDDPLEFLQDGYKKLPLATSLTQTFSPAENNALTRKITIGEPDAQGVYHVADIIQDAKWMVYEEETFDTGRVHRRAGVMQVTGNEPDQQERGSVTGRALTVEWMKDPLYVDAEHPNTRWIESWYDPKA